MTTLLQRPWLMVTHQWRKHRTRKIKLIEQLNKGQQGTKVPTRTTHNMTNLLDQKSQKQLLSMTFPLRKGEIYMIKPTETQPRKTSSIVKKGSENCTRSSSTQRQIIMGQTLLRRNTHTKWTFLPAQCNHEATKVTSDIKADQQTSKEHPGKYRGKTHRKKWNTMKMDPHRAAHHTVLSWNTTRVKQKHSSDLDAMKAAKVITYGNSIIKHISATN